MRIPLLDMISEYLSPLYMATEDYSYLQALLADMGWELTLNETQAETIHTVLDIAALLEDLMSIIEQAESGEMDAGTVTEQVILVAQSVFEAVNRLSSVSTSALASLPEPLNEDGWWKEWAEQLPNYLLTRWMHLHCSYLYEGLFFAGIIEETARAEPLGPERTIHWDKLGDFLTDPQKTLTDHYKWGDGFDHATFITNLKRLLNGFGMMSQTFPLSENVANSFYDGADTSDISEVDLPLRTPGRPVTANFFDPYLRLSPVPHGTTASEYGLYLHARFMGQLPASYALGGDWSADLSGLNAALHQSLGIVLQHDSASLAATLPGAISFGINGTPESPWVLFGNPEGMRLELTGLRAAFSAEEKNGQPVVTAALRTGTGDGEGLRLVLNPADGDSFISEILGETELVIGADAGLVWSSADGLKFEGGAGFEVTIPLMVEVGPFSLTELRIALSGSAAGGELVVAVTGGLDVQVLAVVVEDIGIKATLTPLESGDTSGLLGNLDLKLALKPPVGLGLSIDAGGVVSGGGFISHDESKGQYAGVAEIAFVNLGLSAIGILTTVMPDGSKGWSLFLSIFSEFPAIQLGFGFTLNGVGGLAGLNRSFDDEALRSRLLTGAMDSIMFPEDPVANAPQIINDIEAVFPVVPGQFVFGAMLQIGWGTPSLITANVGVMVELPDPLRIILLGQVAALLPVPDAPIIELHMDAFGVADITAGTFALDATIRDSSIVKLLTLSGDMALRAAFADNPVILLSVGGFNPRFLPPDGFPTLRLMKASLPLGDYASVDVSCYFAMTSNTLQTGGRLDIWAEFSGFSAEGYMEMDALIQFVPFGFQFHTGFGVSVKAGSITLAGVDVSADVTGPRPWEIYGTATFEILKIKKSIDLEITVGKAASADAPDYDIADLLTAALSDATSWSVVEDDEAAKFILLRELETDEEPRAHPTGKVSVVQKIVPLNVELEAFGGVAIEGTNRFDVEELVVGADARPPADDENVDEWFATAQYFKMSDSEKISAPSFEKMDGGVMFGSGGSRVSDAVALSLEYEEIYIDPALDHARTPLKKGAALSQDRLAKFSPFGTMQKARAANNRLKGGAKAAPQFEIMDRSYASLDTETAGISGMALTAGKGKTYVEARQVAKTAACTVIEVSELA